MDIASGRATLYVNWSDKDLHIMAISPTESNQFTRSMNCLSSMVGECRNKDADVVWS